MEQLEYLRKLITASPCIYGKINHATPNGRFLSVYIVSDGRIEDITALVCRVSTFVLSPKGLYVQGTGFSHIQSVQEQLMTLLNLNINYSTLVSNYA